MQEVTDDGPIPRDLYEEQIAYVRSVRGLGDRLFWALYLSPTLTLAEMIRITGCPAGAVSSALAKLAARWIVVDEDVRLVTHYRLSHAFRRRLYRFVGDFEGQRRVFRLVEGEGAAGSLTSGSSTFYTVGTNVGRRLQAAGCILQSADYRLQIAVCRLQYADRSMQIGEKRPHGG